MNIIHVMAPSESGSVKQEELELRLSGEDGMSPQEDPGRPGAKDDAFPCPSGIGEVIDQMRSHLLLHLKVGKNQLPMVSADERQHPL